MMEVDFDSEELLGKLALHRAISRGEVELLIAYDDETRLEAGYALVCCRGLYGYVLLKYVAIFPWYRGKGLGVETMRLVHKRYADRQGILAELTEFADPEPDHLKKLFRFFGRFGYAEIPSDYRIGGAAAHVLVKPIRGEGEDILHLAVFPHGGERYHALVGLGAAHEIQLAAVGLDHHHALLARAGGDMPQGLVHIALGDEDLVDGAPGAQGLNDGVSPLNQLVFNGLTADFLFFFHNSDLVHNHLVYILP